MRPKLALFTAMRLSPGVVPGISKFTWLKTLKNSMRSCTLLWLVPYRKFLNRPMFQLWNDGPRRNPLGTSPKVPTSATANAAGLNQSVGSDPDGGASGWPVSLARSLLLPRPRCDRSDPLTMLNGRPLSNSMTPDHCQPPATHFTGPVRPSPGRSTTHDVVKRCVRSWNSGPHTSGSRLSSVNSLYGITSSPKLPSTLDSV